MNKPNRVFFHCADTPDSRESKFKASDVDRWHKERGWRGIGYHWFIRRNGIAEPGRDEREIGAHVKGQNRNSIGICYEGSHFPTMAQIRSLICLYQRINMDYGIDYTSWFGHNEFANKDCPGFDARDLREILREVKLDRRTN